MRIGFFAIGFADVARPEILAAAAKTAEEVGISTLWASEHIVLPEEFESVYPYARGKEAPASTDVAILNPFVALAYAAAVTTTIRLATGVCLVPEYNPLLLAKLASSVDVLSDGQPDIRRRRRLAEGGVRGARRSMGRPGPSLPRVNRGDAPRVG